MSNIERVIEACENLTHTVELTTDSINAAMQVHEQRIIQKENQVNDFLASASPEPRIVNRITIGGSKDYLYPVWFKFPEEGGNLKIWRDFLWNSDTRPLNPTLPHQAGLKAEIEGSASPWSGNPTYMHLKRFGESYNNVMSHLNFNMYCKNEKYDQDLPLYGGGADGLVGPYCSAASGLYLRGGGVTYEFIANWDIEIEHSDSHTPTLIREGVVSPEAGSYRWTVAPIPVADLLTPIGNTKPYSNLFAPKVEAV
ncbi:phage tail protein [Pseudoalteromonas luteoviolacea]|uniref:phage tail protein n=1 Tax=Pseudoalteromonas luteoviolacea TaxID=43657 RepID=UPI0011526262|nr:phage tail protein [Pseudoalteromonas luteoviolacea]TQF70501.1 phage tail protein [Pseudoalteromonas luteoviolacea]